MRGLGAADAAQPVSRWLPPLSAPSTFSGTRLRAAGAGGLLGLAAVKEQRVMRAISVLLGAGYWKTGLRAVGVMAGLALASVAVIGISGTRDYVSFLISPETLLHPVPWTVKGLVGSGAPSFIATAVVIAAAVAVAIRLRPPPDV